MKGGKVKSGKSNAQSGNVKTMPHGKDLNSKSSGMSSQIANGNTEANYRSKNC